MSRLVVVVVFSVSVVVLSTLSIYLYYLQHGSWLETCSLGLNSLGISNFAVHENLCKFDNPYFLSYADRIISSDIEVLDKCKAEYNILQRIVAPSTSYKIDVIDTVIEERELFVSSISNCSEAIRAGFTFSSEQSHFLKEVMCPWTTNESIGVLHDFCDTIYVNFSK